MNNWYEQLQRPPLTPPNWVFGPAWTILYIMIGISFFLYVRSYKNKKGYGIYFLLALHLLSNFSWTSFFFGLQNPALALIDIIFLDITLVLLVYLFWQENRTASILLWPYLAWVLFATYLNAGFYVLNKN